MPREAARDPFSDRRRTRWLYWLAAIAPLVALAVVWLPELRHWHVERVRLSDDMLVRALQDVRSSTAAELERFDLPGFKGWSNAQVLQAAREVAQGQLTLIDGRTARIDPSFVPRDLEAVPLDLEIASLIVPNLYLRAYRTTGDARYLGMARTYVLRWIDFERGRFLPRGMQWNDHAIAERVFVLTGFLSATRHFDELTREEARAVLECLLESGRRLGKPGFYTFRTNHGVMQNLALLHLGASLPHLPQARDMAQLGAERFERQLAYYISEEGVILEHSAGYQEFGLELLPLAIRELELLGLDAAPALRERYARALDVYSDLLRPDGSLPPWGDTKASDRSPPAADAEAFRPPAKASQRSLFAPVAGLAVIWTPTQQAGSQTLVTWSDFATGAHKQRDEMSMYLWADGQEVVVGPGYWPYASELWADAVGWRGSNAPHFEREPSTSKSTTRLLGHASSAQLEFFDLQRSLESGGAQRRQLLFVRPTLWVTLDSSQDAPAASTIVNWTFAASADVTATTPDQRHLVVRSAAAGPAFDFRTQGCEGGTLTLERGSAAPFAGWTALSGKVEAAHSLVRKCPAGAWTATILTYAAQGGVAVRPVTVEGWQNPENWQLSDSSGQVLAQRRGDVVSIRDTSGAGSVDFKLAGEPSSEREQAQINARYRAMGAEFTRYKESHLYYRYKVTIAVAALWLAQLLLLGWSLRWTFGFAPVLARVAGLVACGFWVLLAVWLRQVYFST
jgi:hypothetical protein